MRKLFFILCVSMMVFHVNIAQATEVTIKVTDIDVKRGGSIIVLIFDENGFPMAHKKALFSKSSNTLQETMMFTFNLSLEEMAVKVLHDEDKNGKVTKNWTGIYPGEGLGFSKEQKVTMTGPPIYEESKLSRDEFINGLRISLLYP